VLRYTSREEPPNDLFGRLSFAVSMEEKIEMMKEYDAVFVEEASKVSELHPDIHW